MKNLIYLLLAALLVACKEKKQAAGETKPLKEDVAIIQPKDSVAVKVIAAIEKIEKDELEFVSTIQRMTISDVHYKMVSIKEYYTAQKDQMVATFKRSTDPQKTLKVIAYLDQLILKASDKQNIYQVEFHLKAALGNKTVYNQDYTKYLREDLSVISMRYPNL